MIHLKSESEITSNCILYFYTEFMPFVKRYNQIMANLNEKYKINVFGVDPYEFMDLAKKHKVSYVPTFIFIKDDLCVSKLEGLVMASAIKSKYLTIFKGKEND